jgi:TolB-like protein
MWSVTAGLPVRVNAQLVDGTAGWANRFDEDMADVFKLQDQVVARLAAETLTRLIETKRSLLIRMAWC